MPPLNIWNTTLVSLSPDMNTYELKVLDLSIQPDLSVYDYTLTVTADLNELFTDFTFTKNEESQEYVAAGQLKAWKKLHTLLKTGQADDVVAAQMLTTLHGGVTITNRQEIWNGFWAHFLSESLDDDDKAGLSVKNDTVQARTNFPTNLGKWYNDTLVDNGVLAATNDNFQNDITGRLNDMMSGYKTTLGALNQIASWAKVPQPVGLETAGRASDDYFPALAHFLYQHRGALTGNEGSLDGNPTGTARKFAFLEGDSLSIRMACSMNFTKTAKITITHCRCIRAMGRK